MSLAELNRVSDVDALTGEEEAAAYVAGDYLKMHRSTLRKLDMFANFFDRTHQNTLMTNSTWIQRNGIHPVAILEAAKDHPLITALLLIGGVLGAFSSIAGLASALFDAS